MPKQRVVIPSQQIGDYDRRERLSTLFVLVADRNHRTASLVQRILFSFGFRNLDITTSGESALALLRERRYDIIITELTMTPVDGIALIKAIRAAKEDARIRHDIPIIMLTARTDIESVSMARDAGVTEFVAKPFSAKTISNRIIQIIDHPRAFVESPVYVGPDRRRRGLPPDEAGERRGGQASATLHPVDTSLQKHIGGPAVDLLDERAVLLAQEALLEAEDDFLLWAADDIKILQQAFRTLQAQPEDAAAFTTLRETAYIVQSQAGIFGYALGGEVAGMLANYLRSNPEFDADQLTVVSKHIEAITVIFKQNIKDKGQAIAVEMRRSLIQLTKKLG